MSVDETLIMKLFDSLDKKVDQMSERLDTKIDKVTLDIAGTHAMIADLNGKVAIQNGGVKKALEKLETHESWQHEHDKRTNHDLAVVEGRKAQRKDDYAKINAVQTFVSDWWPMILGGLIGSVGAISFAWSWHPW